MRKTLTILGSTVALAGLAGTAAAVETRSYSYIDLGYAYTEYNDFMETFGIDLEGSGATFQGSVAVSDSIHAFLDWSDQDLNYPLDVETMAVGLGYHRALTPRVDMVFSTMYLQAKTDPDPGSSFGNDYDGMGFELGLRGHLVGNWEMEGAVRYASIGQFIDDTLFRVKARYMFNDLFGLNFGVDVSNEQVVYNGGFRLSFGQ
jgi:opacity protein-like surface antigen